MADRMLEMTADIIANYVTGNKIGQADIPALIQTVFQALSTVDAPEVVPVPETSKATPAQIRKSITPEALISFEDGKAYRTLKRHLTTRGMTAAEYRSKWGLPTDYPTTAPGYSAMRSQMAKSLGLGQKRKVPAKPAKTRKA